MISLAALYFCYQNLSRYLNEFREESSNSRESNTASSSKPDSNILRNLTRCETKDCIYCPTDFLTPKSLLTTPRLDPQPNKANAVITILCRNKDIHSVLYTLSSFERKINSKLQYPYVFLNDEAFSDLFKDKVSEFIFSLRPDARMKFSTIPFHHWSFPSWIDRNKARQSLVDNANNYRYGSLKSYRFMIRYFSGPFFHHPDLLEYDYYWRVEPDVDFYCDIQYDPFLFMQEKKIKYGFNMIMLEGAKTIPTLYQTVRNFKLENKIAPKRMMKLFVSPRPCGEGNIGDGECGMGECCGPTGWCGTSAEYCSSESPPKVKHDSMENFDDYNALHFWSNFEIADFSFFRSKQYSDYFDYLDKTGGFFYERWGDAPVHSLAVGLFLDPEQVHDFGGMGLSNVLDIGYRHDDRRFCPRVEETCKLDCSCKKDGEGSALISRWYQLKNQ